MVNALWSGGAEAMTIQDQRVISTTGVKCVGNTVVLHGVPYAPPYVISAIGDQERLRAALADSEPVQIYRQYVEAYGLVYRERSPAEVTLRPHEGSAGPAICAATEPGYGRMTAMAARILVIDNYDSFVYNLVQYLAQIGAEVEVWRNDDPRFADPDFAERLRRDPALSGSRASPRRPGSASTWCAARRVGCRSSESASACRRSGSRTAGVVDRAPELLHGKTSLILHEGVGVLAGLPSPFTATRYHSLAIEPDTMPDVLEVTATTPERGDHGRPAPRAAGRGGAVPPRVGADRVGLPDARQLARRLR